MEISLHPVGDIEVAELLADLTPEDRMEILAMGYDPEWGVRNSVETSLECAAIRKDGTLACLTGISEPIALGEGVRPWMLATNFMRQHPMAVLRISRLIIRRWRDQHPYMVNYVDSRHCEAVKWLAWLGADLTLIPEFGPYKRPFYKFEFGAP